MKKKLYLIAHISVWILGTAVLVSGAFNNNIWFDESYTVGLVKHSLSEIIKISSADVHPPFYYIILKLYSMVFGTSIISLRMFSVLCASLLGGLGFTHLRKDFGEKIGFYYTLFTFLFIATFNYAVEIRMYTLAPLLVTLMCIYAYRFYKSEMADKKSGILLMFFSLLSAYTHHYGLAAAGAVNFMLLIYSKRNKQLKKWFLMAAIQIAAYGYGLFLILQQFLSVKGGFWISMNYPDIAYQAVSFFLLGDITADGFSKTTLNIYYLVCFTFWIAFITFGYKYNKKHPDEMQPVTLTMKTIGLVIGFFFVASLKQPLYYIRYVMVLWGLIIFVLAFLYDKIRYKTAKTFVQFFLVALLIIRIVPFCQDMYSPKTAELDSFIEESIKEGDIVISENVILIPVVAVKHTDKQMVFYNIDCWGVEEAYEAFQPNMLTLRDISGVINENSRVWIIDASDELCEYITEKSGKTITNIYDVIELPYHDLRYVFTLME